MHGSGCAPFLISCGGGGGETPTQPPPAGNTFRITIGATAWRRRRSSSSPRHPRALHVQPQPRARHDLLSSSEHDLCLEINQVGFPVLGSARDRQHGDGPHVRLPRSQRVRKPQPARADRRSVDQARGARCHVRKVPVPRADVPRADVPRAATPSAMERLHPGCHIL